MIDSSSEYSLIISLSRRTVSLAFCCSAFVNFFFAIVSMFQNHISSKSKKPYPGDNGILFEAVN